MDRPIKSPETTVNDIADGIVHLDGLTKKLQKELRQVKRQQAIEAERKARLSDEALTLLLVNMSASKGLSLAEIERIFRMLGKKIERKTISSYLSRARKSKLVSKLPKSSVWLSADSIKSVYPDTYIDENGIVREKKEEEDVNSTAER